MFTLILFSLSNINDGFSLLGFSSACWILRMSSGRCGCVEGGFRDESLTRICVGYKDSSGSSIWSVWFWPSRNSCRYKSCRSWSMRVSCVHRIRSRHPTHFFTDAFTSLHHSKNTRTMKLIHEDSDGVIPFRYVHKPKKNPLLTPEPPTVKSNPYRCAPKLFTAGNNYSTHHFAGSIERMP